MQASTPLLETFIADQNAIETVTAVPKLEELQTMSLNKNKIADAQMLVAEIQHRFPKLSWVDERLQSHNPPRLVLLALAGGANHV